MLTITNSSINNANIIGSEDKAGGLVGYTDSDVTISGTHINGDLRVACKKIAGGFAGQSKKLTITNSSIKNANIVGSEDRAGGLVGYTDSDVTISETDIKGKLTVQGKNQVGGFVGQLAGNATIQKSHILNATIISNEADAGGLIGYVLNSILTIQEVSVEGLNAEVIAAKNAGGLIGCLQSCGNLKLEDVNVTAFVTSDSTDNQGGAGGFFGYITGLGAKPVIKDCHYYGADIKEQKNSLTQNLYTANINAKKSAGGIIGYAACNVELTDLTPENAIIASSEGYAGGLVGSSGSVTIKVNDKDNQSNKVNDSVKLYKMIVVGNEAAGGIIGNAGKDAVIKNVNLEQVKITSGVSYAGGLIGNVEQYIPITIDQITLDQCEITGSQATGGFIGRVSNATVTIENSNVKNSSTIKSKQNVAGGLIGYTNQITNIKDTSITKSNITGYGCTGGFIGQYDQSNDLNRTITMQNSSARESTIISTNDKVGGFIGRADGSINLDRVIVENAQITGTNNGAGGLIGITSRNADIKNIKVIGENTIISGRDETGGMIGACSMQSDTIITINNAAVSVPIQSWGNYAGGFIGYISYTYGLNSKSVEISNSYYAGRTQNGSYVLKKAFDTSKPDQISDYANIMGHVSAGGFIGYDKDVKMNFKNCFSTGAVMAGVKAGGIIGHVINYGYNEKITLNNCYSMGHVAGPSSGGYIGVIDNAKANTLACNNAYYLNCFNSLSTNLIGNEALKTWDANIINNTDRILGGEASADLTTAEHTHNYDETLNGQSYPYKNWTTDWEIEGATENTPIAYYGDWPSPQLNEKFVYYYFTGDQSKPANYKNGGTFKISGYETSFTCDLKPYNTPLDKRGFGIISDVQISDEESYKYFNDRYSWSATGEEEYSPCNIMGGTNDIKYAEFNYAGKKYYFYRCTGDKLKNLANTNSSFLLQRKSPDEMYLVSVNNENAVFTPVPAS